MNYRSVFHPLIIVVIVTFIVTFACLTIYDKGYAQGVKDGYANGYICGLFDGLSVKRPSQTPSPKLNCTDRSDTTVSNSHVEL